VAWGDFRGELNLALEKREFNVAEVAEVSKVPQFNMFIELKNLFHFCHVLHL